MELIRHNHFCSTYKKKRLQSADISGYAFDWFFIMVYFECDFVFVLQ